MGFIGRYVRPKGIDIVYEIARRMAEEENVCFYTVGAWEDEGLRAELERLRPSNLVDLGFVTDIAGFYAFVDATILPSRRTWREAAGLHELRDDPDLSHRMSRAGIADARRWESATVLDDHERAYLELASLTGGGRGGQEMAQP